MADTPQHPPTIDFGRLRLRPLRKSDAVALYTYLRDPAVTELTSYPEVTLRMISSSPGDGDMRSLHSLTATERTAREEVNAVRHFRSIRRL